MIRLVFSAVTLAIVLASGPIAYAQRTWAMLPLEGRGVDAQTVAVFEGLLRDGLSASGDVAWASTDDRCADARCAAGVGARVGASTVFYGHLDALGGKIIVTVTAADTSTGRVTGNQRMTVDRVDDLDAVATRIAAALLSGRSVEETAALGTITASEARAPRRREGQRGVGLRLGGILPLGGAYGGLDTGAGFDVSYWYETAWFSLEPRVGYHFGPEGDDGSQFAEVPFDIGAYFVAETGDVAPYAGGGAGLRWISERRHEVIRTGTVIYTESETLADDDAWGFSLFGRVGVLLFRTYTMRLAVSAEYNISFLDLNGRSNPRAVSGGISIYF